MGLVVLLAVSALSAPYLNLVHDARLYALQVQNRVSNGAFSTDLFLRFGSQDQYTLFSRMVAPLAKVLGIEWSFFVLFLLFNTLLVVAIQSIVDALVENRLVSMLAQLSIVISPLPYGGLTVFHVRESFFTPRVVACALALFALTCILRQRWVAASALALGATLAHPLMGFGALLIVAVCYGLDVLPRGAAITVFGLATVVGVVTLGYRPLGTALFGTMDPDWLEIVRGVAPYNFPDQWLSSDWIRALTAIALSACAALVLRRDSPRRARFLPAIAFTATLGLAATLVAARIPYRLLLQGQPYRIVWILQALAIPVTFLVAARAWRAGGSLRVVAVLILGLWAIDDFTMYELVVPLVVLPIFIGLHRRFGRTPWRPDALAVSVAASLVTGSLCWAFLKIAVVLRMAPDLLRVMDPVQYVTTLAACLPRFVWLFAILMCLASLLPPRRSVRQVGFLAIAIAIVAHVGAFSYDPRGADLAFVRRYFSQRYAESPKPPTVYAAAWGRIAYVWFDLHAQSYFDLRQVDGALFSRATALEGRRRAGIVRPFELDRSRSVGWLLHALDRRMIAYLFDPDRPAPPPSLTDLARVCAADEGVDVALLDQDFPNVRSAGNGHVFVYECARVRALTH